MRAFQEYDSRGRLHEIAVPALVIHGGADIQHPESRGIAEEIPHSELVVLEGEAHQPFQEVPERWNAIVREFWARR